MAGGKKNGRARKSKKRDDFVVEFVDRALLKPHPRNYKQHPEDQLEHICASVKQYGFYRPVVVARDHTILVGHGLVLAAEKLGIDRVPVKILPLAPDSPKALKLLALDNELGRFAVGDDRMLSELLREVRDADINGLLGTGYDDQNLAAFLMVTRPASEIGSFDAAAEWVGMPEYDAGGSDKFKLVMTFDTDELRKEFVRKFQIVVNKQVGAAGVLSAKWPPVDKFDASSVKFRARA